MNVNVVKVGNWNGIILPALFLEKLNLL